MPEIAAFRLRGYSSNAASRTGVLAHHDARVLIEQDAATGPRLKYYSRAADVQYWTEVWNERGEVSYSREERGHLPHQLRGILRRWVLPGATLLEAGCGLGHFTVAAAAVGYRAEGVDWSAATIQRLRRRFPSIPWHIGDVRTLDFRNGTFDALYSPGVCEHFERGPSDVLLETRRVLRSGGIAIVSTPCFNTWLQRHPTRVTTGVAVCGAEFYQYAFTPAGMASLLEQLGFEIVQVRPYAVLETLVRHGGWRIPERLSSPLAFALDYVPYVRQWGSACLWVARKC